MKKMLKNALGVSVVLSCILFLLVGCGDKPTPLPPKPVPPVVHNPTITVIQQPGVLWNGGIVKWDYSSNDADTVKINGVVVPNWGTYTVPSVVTSAEVTFEVKYGKTVGPSITKTATAVSPEISIACGYGSYPIWSVKTCSIFFNGVWSPGPLICQPSRFNATGDSLRIFFSQCQATPDAWGVCKFYGSLATNDLKIFWGQTPGATPLKVEKMSADSIVTSYINADGAYIREARAPN